MTSTPRWRTALGWVGAVVLGAVLLVAVYAKVIDPVAFAEQIAGEGLDFFGRADLVALLALAIEAGLGMALLLGVRRPIVLVPATVLVVFFLFLTGRTWYRAANGLEVPASCGCFGNLLDRTPKEAFWGDLLLLVPPLLLAWFGRERSAQPARWRLLASGVVTAGVVVFGVLAPGLPLDDLATRLRLGLDITQLCAGKETRVCLTDLVHTEDLSVGRHWVILADLEALDPVVDQTNEMVWSGTAPSFVVLSPDSQDAVSRFGFERGPAFAIGADAPVALIRPLYRRLPRSFLVEDGLVVEVSGSWPPWLLPPSSS